MPKVPTPPPSAAPGGERQRRINWAEHGAGNYSGDSDRIKWSSSGEGDTITGTIGRVDEVTTRFGVKPIIELNNCTEVIAGLEPQEDGDYTIWPTPGLIDALDRADADQGDKVVIELEKLVPSSYGNPFKQYGAQVVERAF